MKNKILVELIVPDIDEKYDVFIPINKNVANIILLLSKSIREISNSDYILDTFSLYSGEDGTRYNPENLIIDTNIRNGSTIILM